MKPIFRFVDSWQIWLFQFRMKTRVFAEEGNKIEIFEVEAFFFVIYNEFYLKLTSQIDPVFLNFYTRILALTINTTKTASSGIIIFHFKASNRPNHFSPVHFSTSRKSHEFHLIEFYLYSCDLTYHERWKAQSCWWLLE